MKYLRVKNWERDADDWSVNETVVRWFRGRLVTAGQLSFLLALQRRVNGAKTYFLLDEAAGVIKIGTSNTPAARIGSHQCRWPRHLTFIGYVLDHGNIESELHRLLRSERATIGNEKEWFRWTRKTRAIVSAALVRNDI